jgi:hypothetical protein
MSLPIAFEACLTEKNSDPILKRCGQCTKPGYGGLAMEVRNTSLSAALGLAFLLVGASIPSSVSAQDGSADTPTSSEISGHDLSSPQKNTLAEKTAAELDGRVKRVLKLIDEASKKKDIILLNCLNDKLLSLRGLHKVSVDAQHGLAEAIVRENVDLEEHNFRKVFIARDQGEIVAAEADACVGQVGTSFPGQTQVVMKFDGTSEADDDFGAAPGGNTRPPDASPID